MLCAVKFFQILCKTRLKSNVWLKKMIIKPGQVVKSPGQEVKKYPSSVRLDNRKVFSCIRF